jgi:hypothetical protein
MSISPVKLISSVLKATVFTVSLFSISFTLLPLSSTYALDLDWGGQFRAESHLIRNYTFDASQKIPDATRQNAGGYYISPNGNSNAAFQSLFMRVNPKVTVNDNVYIKSEWWLGNPVFGFYGNGAPQSSDGRNYDTNFSRGSVITAQRFWAEILSDFGTFQIGRAPLNWGLGLVWNSGDEILSRYPSTGDMIRMASKFGFFTFAPAYIKYSAGNTIAGACNFGTGPNCTPIQGTADTREYSIALKYHNTDEDFEVGANLIRRLVGAIQDSTSGIQVPGQIVTPTSASLGPGGARYNIWDLYFKKRLKRFHLGIEAPIATGEVGGIEYRAFTVVAQTKLEATESWNLHFDLGQVSGQQSGGNLRPGRFSSFYLHPDYRLGLILSNYAFHQFSGVQTQNNPNVSSSTLNSPFYNPLTNARFLSLKSSHEFNKWTFFGKFIYAHALQTARKGEVFYNQWTRSFRTANGNQQKGLGIEFDLGARFQWDDHLSLGTDFGFYFPGAFYKFSNLANVSNRTSMVFASNLFVGIQF